VRQMEILRMIELPKTVAGAVGKAGILGIKVAMYGNGRLITDFPDDDSYLYRLYTEGFW
jgi:hypothetical protein